VTNGASLNDQYIRTLILIKARSLMKSPAFRGVERDDVLRDLTLILAKRLGQFDPERAQLRTFVSRVLDSAAITLLRARQREKRSGDHGMASIERLRESQTTDPVAGSAAVGEADAARRLGREVRSPIEDFHLSDSIREIVQRCPQISPTCAVRSRKTPQRRPHAAWVSPAASCAIASPSFVCDLPPRASRRFDQSGQRPCGRRM